MHPPLAGQFPVLHLASEGSRVFLFFFFPGVDKISNVTCMKICAKSPKLMHNICLLLCQSQEDFIGFYIFIFRIDILCSTESLK